MQQIRREIFCDMEKKNTCLYGNAIIIISIANLEKLLSVAHFQQIVYQVTLLSKKWDHVKKMTLNI